MSSELEKPPTPYSTKTKPNRTLPRPFHTCNTSILDAYYTTRDRLEILAQESLNWSLDSGSKTERRIVMETSSRSFLYSTLNTSAFGTPSEPTDAPIAAWKHYQSQSIKSTPLFLVMRPIWSFPEAEGKTTHHRFSNKPAVPAHQLSAQQKLIMSCV